HVWSCGPTDRWDDPANWIPGSVPGSGADVYVPAGTAMSPVLAVDRQIRSLTVEDGARVEIQDRVLTVAGSVRGGRIASGSGGGLLVLTGASAELSGDLPALSVLGSVALAADSRAEGDVTVSPGATLGLAGHGLTVAGDLAATATAPDGSTGVQLHGPGDRLVVEGAATFAHQGSGTSEGGLTAGTVVVRGDFDAASDFGFVSTGTHTVLDGSAVQTVHSLGRRQPGQNQFWGLDLANASGVVFLSSVNAMGDGVWDGRVEVRSGRAVKVFGLLTLESGMFLKNDGFVMYGTLDDRGATVQGNAPFAIP
ncbi:MAG TPA: hypothetical protein VLL48_05755, partial [Longimicrobiales bacterium]|nr:hypothetical protein [Longimicrobiales bacterium]